MAGLQAVSGEQPVVYFRRGLDQPLLAGNQNILEAGEKREARLGMGPGFSGKIGEAVERNAGLVKVAHQRGAARHAAGQHFWPPVLPGLNGVVVLGVKPLPLRQRLVHRSPAIHGQIPLLPLRRADLGEKVLQRRLVLENPPIEVARIPVDQDRAHVEYNCGNACFLSLFRQRAGGHAGPLGTVQRFFPRRSHSNSSG